MLNPVIHKFQYNHKTVILETGIMARQANAAVMTSIDGTSVFVTLVCSEQTSDYDFFPLTVHYQERTYAAGKFPGGFFRREGRLSEHEILTSRLIDRSIRPLFSSNFLNELQITATLVSLNPNINPDIVAIIGVSAVLNLSGVPFKDTIGIARVGLINNKYVLNPTMSELKKSNLNLVVTCTSTAIIMVESESYFLSENQILNAITYGYEQQQIVIHNINEFTLKVSKKIYQWQLNDININLQNEIFQLIENPFKQIYFIKCKKERFNKINTLKKSILDILLSKYKESNINNIKNIINNLEKKIIRNQILETKLRIDGREVNKIRDLDIKIGILSRTHGSALFTRGETQALVTVTLGTDRDAQDIDELIGEKISRFLLHYNFPAYCTGEIGLLGPPKRREIGHGNLAKKGLLAIMPKINIFPYTIRVVSEITESNGSSSMASVCGASLALMDAGVPIREAVAGIAMGLIKENNKFLILSDISGEEDYIGDMDFKIIGSKIGITALQMDVKSEGINQNILKLVFEQAKDARIIILEKMNNIISVARNNISRLAPRIYIIKIDPNKIRYVIGKNGVVIRTLTEKTDTIIEVENDGTIKIAAKDERQANYVIKRIKEITTEIKIGNIYTGTIIRIVNFGVFVSFDNNEGLVHISEINHKQINKIKDYLKIGQEVLVKVIEIDHSGRIRLSMKNTKI